MMATYLYKCPVCHDQVEHQHSMMEEPRIECAICRTRMQRVINVEYSGMSRKTSDNRLSDWENTKFR